MFECVFRRRCVAEFAWSVNFVLSGVAFAPDYGEQMNKTTLFLTSQLENETKTPDAMSLIVENTSAVSDAGVLL